MLCVWPRTIPTERNTIVMVFSTTLEVFGSSWTAWKTMWMKLLWIKKVLMNGRFRTLHIVQIGSDLLRCRTWAWQLVLKFKTYHSCHQCEKYYHSRSHQKQYWWCWITYCCHYIIYSKASLVSKLTQFGITSVFPRKPSETACLQQKTYLFEIITSWVYAVG